MFYKVNLPPPSPAGIINSRQLIAVKNFQLSYLAVAVSSALIFLSQSALADSPFNRDTLEYQDVVTPNLNEVQIGNDRTYVFHEGGELGRIWVLYDNTEVEFNIAEGKQLTVGVNSNYDGLKISEGTLTITGGDLTTRIAVI